MNDYSNLKHLSPPDYYCCECGKYICNFFDVPKYKDGCCPHCGFPCGFPYWEKMGLDTNKFNRITTNR